MKIAVCVKQVPEIADVRINPDTGTLIREGVKSILNPFCEYALDEAVNLKRKLTGIDEDIEIVAVTMGPPQAKTALLRCLELGADRCVLLSDRKFAGADTWATALTVSEILKKEKPDLILTGKQAIDGDTAQVGPEIAEILGISQICYAISTNIDFKKKRLIARKEGEKGIETVECRLPALVTMSKGNPIRRLPSLDELIDARSKSILTVSAEELGGDMNRFGLPGSLTQVDKVFPPQMKTGGDKIDGSDPDFAADELFKFLLKNNFLLKPVQGGK